MTIISTAKPVSLDEALAIADAREQEIVNEADYDLFPSFPPIDDAAKVIRSIDWNDVGIRTRDGAGALLLFAMKLSEWSYEFHNNLYDRYCNSEPDFSSVEIKD